MCPSETQDVIDTFPGKKRFDSGVDVDPAVEPNVIPSEAEKVCFFRCPYLYIYISFISFAACIAPFPYLSSRYI